MGGGGTETTTQTSAPTNPAVDATLTQLLGGVQNTYSGVQNMGTPASVSQGWASQLGAAGNADYARGINGATSEFADIASGKRFGMDDPGYKTMRAGALDDAMTGVGSSFLTDGRFGSSVMGDAAGTAATQTLAGLDYANFQNDQQRQSQAAQMLPQLFAAGQAPGSVMASVGEQQMNLPWQNLSRASSILAGTAGAGGQTSSTTQPGAPWWQAPVAIGGTLASAFF